MQALDAMSEITPDSMPGSGRIELPEGIAIVPMTEAVLDQVAAIEDQSFPDPWPRRFFHEELTRSDPAYARVAIAGGQVSGYLVAWFILDEVHLGNLAVHPAHRRRGIGRCLLEHLIEQAERGGASLISLEVRAGNRAAMSLYARHHFRPEGIRKGYYAGREDAVIMVRERRAEPALGQEDPQPTPASAASEPALPAVSTPEASRKAGPAPRGGRPRGKRGSNLRES